MKTILSGKRHRYLPAISILLIFSVTVALTAGMIGCGGGEEEEEKEYRIQDWYDLNNGRDKLGADYVWILEDDLDCDTLGWNETASRTANGGKGWQPIGNGTNPFKGGFDGNGHTISDLYIYRPDEDEVGLFGRVQGVEVVVKNVGLVSVNVTGKKSVGALVGYNWKGTLDSDDRPPGSQTFSSGIVTGEEDVGGLVGNNRNGEVNQCESSALVFHAPNAPDKRLWRAGGLAGLNSGVVLNCDYNGEVKGDREVGGMIGLNEAGGSVRHCDGEYMVTGYAFVGGIAGHNGILNTSAEVVDCHFEGCVIKLPYTGSCVALSDDATPDGWYFGGIVGKNDANANVEDCSAQATVQADQYVGGFAGANWGNVTRCSSSGKVTANSDVGQLVGYNKGTVSNSQSTSCVTDAPDCGPLVGRDEGVVISDGLIPLKNPGDFVQMIPGDIDSLDPAWAYDTASCEQVQYIYETLLFYDAEKTDQFVPGLATEWNSSPDGMTIRFKIHRGVTFHNGNSLTPEDVEYSIERAMVQDRGRGPAWMFFQPLLGAWSSDEVTFADIDGTVEVDGDWVAFHLIDPSWDLAFLQILCGPWASIVDKEWCVANGEWDGTEATWMDFDDPESGSSYLWDKTNGTGPWQLEYWDPGIEISLIRFDDYWREPAPFERIITKKVEEWTTRKLAFLAGDADLVYVPLTYIDELVGIEDLNIYQGLPQLTIDAFFMTFDIDPASDYIGSGALDGEGIPTDFFSDIDVRKGFNYAFDWEAYVNAVYMGEAEQRGSPIIEGLSFYNPNASMYSLDVAKAEEHLKLAWGGELWETGFEFTLLYNSGSLARATACEILAQNLAAINPKFQVLILPADWPTYLEKIATRDMPMFQIDLIANYPHPDSFVVPFMHSTAGVFAKWQSYGSPELDELIEAAFKELDPGQQQAKYYELQGIYYQDPSGIMLCQPLGRRYFTRYIHGFYFNPMICGQAGPLYYMSKSS